MIKNNRFFVQPVADEVNFKDLFQQLMSQGAGRPVDEYGVPDGPWTPQLLTEAICSLDSNPTGIELRTVQLWFQNNDRGINYGSLRSLARIFGCNDPQSTSEWQLALKKANSRLRIKREIQTNSEHLNHDKDVTKGDDGRSKISIAIETVFGGHSTLNLPIAIWAGGFFLWLLVYFFKLHSVTYNPREGLVKEVGFFWAPSWTVEQIVLVPVFLMFISDLFVFWKNEARPSLIHHDDPNDGWKEKMLSFELSFRIVFWVSFLLIFLLQWYGVYFRPLMLTGENPGMVDWVLVALERSDLISREKAAFISFVAFFYTGLLSRILQPQRFKCLSVKNTLRGR